MRIRAPRIPENVRIAVIGDVMCDRRFYCRTLGVSPESDSALKLRFLRGEDTPGGAANVAMNLVSLGVKEVHLYGGIGSDSTGELVYRKLRDAGVTFHYVRIGETTVKTRIITEQGHHICRLDHECEVSGGLSSLLGARKLREALSSYAAVIVSDYAKGMVDDGVLNELRASSVPFYVDPKRDDVYGYRGAVAITPNEIESERLVFSPSLIPSRTRPPLSFKAFIVTAAGKGCMLYTASVDGVIPETVAVYHHIPAVRRTSGDPTGCGDSFISGLVVAHLSGLNWVESCLYANACGALAFDKVGTAPVSAEEAEREIERHPEAYSAVRDAVYDVQQGVIVWGGPTPLSADADRQEAAEAIKDGGEDGRNVEDIEKKENVR